MPKRISKSQTQCLKRIRQLRKKMDEIISEHGYMIQVVYHGEDSFAYTIGRNDKGNPDFVLKYYGGALVHLFKEAVALFDQQTYDQDKIYESTVLVCKTKPEEATKFKMQVVQVEDFKDIVLGVYNRYSDLQFVELVQIIPANEFNEF